MANISALIQPSAGSPMTAPGKLQGSGNLPGAPIGSVGLHAVAERFEAAFLAEMLRHSGLGEMPDSFNGGAGESALSGTLVQEYANKIAASGTLGIADRIYRTLSERGTK